MGVFSCAMQLKFGQDSNMQVVFQSSIGSNRIEFGCRNGAELPIRITTSAADDTEVCAERCKCAWLDVLARHTSRTPQH
jgi:hypothetical protein